MEEGMIFVTRGRVVRPEWKKELEEMRGEDGAAEEILRESVFDIYKDREGNFWSNFGEGYSWKPIRKEDIEAPIS